MTQPGNELTVSGAYDHSITGLEDFGVEDLKLPRLSIDHEHGGYVDSLAPEVFHDKIEVVTLGLIKQRVLWPALISDDSSKKNPMCRSVDNTVGYPNIISSDPQEAFPWQATGWNPNDFPKDDKARIQLPCNSCRLAQWSSHPDGKKTWCSQQYAIVLLYGPEGSTPSMLALFTAQRSSINAAKAFFGSIFRRELPAYAVRAHWGLNAQMRGKNKYYVPTMIATGETDQALWAMYQQNYLQVRQHVTREPRVDDDQQQASVSGQGVAAQNVNTGFGNTTWTPTPQAQPAQPVQPVQQAAPVIQAVVQPAVDPEYEAWRAQQAAAKAAQAAQQAQPVVTQPVPQAAPVAEPAAMPFPGSPAPASAATARDDEPLPF